MILFKIIIIFEVKSVNEKNSLFCYSNMFYVIIKLILKKLTMKRIVHEDINVYFIIINVYNPTTLNQ